ncbi:MAG: hypothetical protein ACRCYY_16690 [Trueperaceae bacterium]
MKLNLNLNRAMSVALVVLTLATTFSFFRKRVTDEATNEFLFVLFYVFAFGSLVLMVLQLLPLVSDDQRVDLWPWAVTQGLAAMLFYLVALVLSRGGEVVLAFLLVDGAVRPIPVLFAALMVGGIFAVATRLSKPILKWMYT